MYVPLWWHGWSVSVSQGILWPQLGFIKRKKGFLENDFIYLLYQCSFVVTTCNFTKVNCSPIGMQYSRPEPHNLKRIFPFVFPKWENFRSLTLKAANTWKTLKPHFLPRLSSDFSAHFSSNSQTCQVVYRTINHEKFWSATTGIFWLLPSQKLYTVWYNVYRKVRFKVLQYKSFTRKYVHFINSQKFYLHKKLLNGFCKTF